MVKQTTLKLDLSTMDGLLFANKINCLYVMSHMSAVKRRFLLFLIVLSIKSKERSYLLHKNMFRVDTLDMMDQISNYKNLKRPSLNYCVGHLGPSHIRLSYECA